MNYQQAHQSQPPKPQPANFRNPNQGSPVIKYILIAGAVLLALLIIATAVIFILSRTYSDDESKDDEASEIEEETDANNPPETGIPKDALRADLLDAGIACNYMDRGLLVNSFVIGTLEATDQPADAFNKNDYKTLTDSFKGPAFSCEDIENTDISSFRLTPDDFKVVQEIVVGAVFEQDLESAAN